MKKTLQAIMATAALFSPSTANAAADCNGTILNMITYATGDVMILGSWRGDWTVLCNVNEERLGVKPQTCFTWFSSISSSMTENKGVRVYYVNLTQAECATMPTYGSSPVPYYVHLIK